MSRSKIYAPKILINGYKLGVTYGGKTLVAIPENKVKEGCMVFFGGKVLDIQPGAKPLEARTFKDKFGRGDYTLCYFDWNPEPSSEAKKAQEEKQEQIAKDIALQEALF